MEYCLASRRLTSYISAMLEMRPCIEAYRRRIREARVSARQRAEQAREAARGCAQKLVEEFGATRVYLFGALAEGRFRLTSDIDLVVEGLAPEKFFKASAAISRFAGDFEVDLIPFEPYKYQAEIIEKGRILYEFNPEQSVAPVERCAEKRVGEVECVGCRAPGTVIRHCPYF